MKKISVKNEKNVLNSLKKGVVKGCLYLEKDNEGHDVICFKAYNCKSKGERDQLIVALETGWLKESSQRIKFFSSVKKEVGALQVSKVMNRELETAMDELFLQNII